MTAFVELERGVWIEDPDQDLAQEVVSLCNVIAECVTDAMLSLYLFDRDMPAGGPGVRRERWQRLNELEARRRQELQAEGYPGGKEPEDLAERELQRMRLIHEKAARDMVRAMWDSGELPHSCALRLPYLHAQTFTKSLARLSRTLRVLETIAPASAQPAVKAACDTFDGALPEVKKLRDSLEHAEDRHRGRDRKGNPLPAVPFNNTFIMGGAHLLISESLIGRRYGGTAEDGTHVEIELSDDTIETARATAQAALNALPWKPGSRRFDPLSSG